MSRSTDGCNGYTTSSRSQTASYTNGSGGVDLRDGSKSFLQDRSKVSGFADVMGRMAATDAVEGTAQSDEQARSLLNRFLGAQVLLTGVESMMANSNGGGQTTVTETRSSSSSATDNKRAVTATTTSGDPVELVKGVDINSEQDEDTLRKLLDSCDAYEDRRKVRQRLKNITANAKGGVNGSGVTSQGVSKRGSARDSPRGSSSSSALRSNQGELLEPIIYDQLQHSLQRNSPVPSSSGLLDSPSGSSVSVAYENNRNAVYDANNYVTPGKEYIDSGTESGDDSSRKHGELSYFMAGIKTTMEDKVDQNADNEAANARQSGEFDTDFMSEVNTVLNKLKNKLAKSKSQNIVIGDEEQENVELVSLIGRLQNSLGDVLADEHQAENEEQHAGRVDQEEDGGSDNDDDEEYESDDGAGFITNELQRSESGLYQSSSFGSSVGGSPGVVTAGLQFSVDMDESKGTVLKVNQKRQRRNEITDSGVALCDEQGSDTLQRKNSRKEARSLLGKAIGRCKSREEIVKQQSDDPNESETCHESSEEVQLAPESPVSPVEQQAVSYEQELPRKRDQKDLPWKIRLAKKKMERQTTKEEAVNLKKQPSSHIRQRQQMYSEVTNSKPRPYKAPFCSQSVSLGNVSEMKKTWQTNVRSDNTQFVGHCNRPVYSRSIDFVKPQNKFMAKTFSAGTISPISPLMSKAPQVHHQGDSDDSDDEDEDDDEGEMFSFKPYATDDASHAKQKTLPGIFHNQESSHGKNHNKSLEKVDKRDNVTSKREVFKKKSVAAVSHVKDASPPVLPPRKALVDQMPFFPRRPTSLAIRPTVPDCRPDEAAPPLPQRGEFPQPPPRPQPINPSKASSLTKIASPDAHYDSNILSRSKSTPSANKYDNTEETSNIQDEETSEAITSQVSQTETGNVKVNTVSQIQNQFEEKMSSEKSSARSSSSPQRYHGGRKTSIADIVKKIDSHGTDNRKSQRPKSAIWGDSGNIRSSTGDDWRKELIIPGMVSQITNDAAKVVNPSQAVKLAIKKAAFKKQISDGGEGIAGRVKPQYRRLNTVGGDQPSLHGPVEGKMFRVAPPVQQESQNVSRQESETRTVDQEEEFDDEWNDELQEEPQPEYGIMGVPSTMPQQEEWNKDPFSQDDQQEEVQKKEEREQQEEFQRYEQRRVQEEMKREELERQAELKRQEEMKMNEEIRRQEELQIQEELKRKEEMKRQQELRRQEMERQEELKRQEKERQEELKRQEKERQEELKRQEKERQEELKRQEMEKQEELKKQQQLKKQEEIRRQKEITKQKELQHQEELKRKAELKKQEDLKKQEELRRKEVMRKQEEVKKQEQMAKQEQKKQQKLKESERKQEEKSKLQYQDETLTAIEQVKTGKQGFEQQSTWLPSLPVETQKAPPNMPVGSATSAHVNLGQGVQQSCSSSTPPSTPPVHGLATQPSDNEEKMWRPVSSAVGSNVRDRPPVWPQRQESTETAGLYNPLLTRHLSKEDLTNRIGSVSSSERNGSQSSAGGGAQEDGYFGDYDTEVNDDEVFYAVDSHPTSVKQTPVVLPGSKHPVYPFLTKEQPLSPPTSAPIWSRNIKNIGPSPPAVNEEAKAGYKKVEPVRQFQQRHASLDHASARFNASTRPDSLKCASQSPELPRKFKPVGGPSNVFGGETQKSSSVSTAESLNQRHSRSQVKKTFEGAQSFSFNNTSPAMPNIAPAPPMMQKTQSLSSAPFSPQNKNLPPIQSSGQKWQSTESVNTSKGSDFVLPPLPTTEMRQQQLKQQQLEAQMKNKSKWGTVNASNRMSTGVSVAPSAQANRFPSPSVSRWGSAPDAVSSAPSLPTTADRTAKAPSASTGQQQRHGSLSALPSSKPGIPAFAGRIDFSQQPAGGPHASGPRSDSRTNSQASTYSSSYSTQSSKVTKVSPFNKFQQLDAQQPTTRRASGGGAAAGGGPLFALSTSLKSSANSIKDVLLCWCQCRTRDYKGIKIENFSTSWNDGMAFCALIHHFYPDAFDFDKLDPKNRRYNFDLAFRTADDRAGVMALLDVEDMVMMKKPDWKCVFTYIQSLYKRLKDE